MGGLSELVLGHGNGLLYARGDAEDCAAKLRSLLTDPELARQVGARGAALLGELGDRDRHVDRLFELYVEEPLLEASS